MAPTPFLAGGLDATVRTRSLGFLARGTRLLQLGGLFSQGLKELLLHALELPSGPGARSEVAQPLFEDADLALAVCDSALEVHSRGLLFLQTGAQRVTLGDTFVGHAQFYLESLGARTQAPELRLLLLDAVKQLLPLVLERRHLLRALLLQEMAWEEGMKGRSEREE